MTYLNRKVHLFTLKFYPMGASKDNNYTIEEIALSQIGRAIAHPARSRIVLSLMHSNTIKNKQLSNLVNLSQPTVKDHLSMLKDADLIQIKYKPHEYIVSLKQENFELLKMLLLPENRLFIE